MVARPVIWGGAAAVALLALAAPALGLRLGQPAVDAPKEAAVVQTMAAIQRAFPQVPAPAEVVVTGADVTGPKVLAAVDALRADAAAGGAIHDPVTTTVIGGGRALVVGVPLAGNGADTASDNALLTLRNQILPDTFVALRLALVRLNPSASGCPSDIRREQVPAGERVSEG